MKKWTLFILVCSFISSSTPASPYMPLTLEKTDTEEEKPNEAGESTYILRLHFPPHIKVPALCAFYKGYRLEFSSDLCLIREATNCSSFIIIIAENIGIKQDEHGLYRLEQSSSKKCKLFYLAKKIRKEGSIEWSVEEEAQNAIPLTLPKSSIIILFNPDYIDTIDPLIAKKPVQDGIFSLPLIEVKKTITQKELDQASKASLCASVDMRRIHPPTGVTKKNDALRLISIARSSKTNKNSIS